MKLRNKKQKKTKKHEDLKKMTNTTDEELIELIEQYVRNLEINELIELWETLTNEVNNSSVLWDMEFFLEEYLPECVSSKSLDVVELVRIVTGNDAYVKHFDVNDDYVYVNSLGLWESINEYDVANLVINFIRDYDCVKYSETIKEKLFELKEDVNKE